MAEESVVVFLRAQIGEFTGKMREAGAEVDTLGTKGASGFQKFQAVGTAALMAVGVAAIAVGAYGLKMADEYEASHARLETAVHNTGGDFEQLQPKIAAVSKVMEDLGFSNADTESSLASLTGVTHDAEKAMTLEHLAADIARGRHIDLATATGILVKVEAGRVGALGRLGIATKDNTGKTISQEEAIRRLTDLYGGSASRYADTFAGKMEVLRTKGTDLAKNIGLELIPVIESLISFGLGLVTMFQNANDATGGWLGKIALIAIAAPLAIVAILKIASGIGSMISALGTAASAISSFAESVALFAMLNPEIAVLAGIAVAVGAVVAALHLWGGAHDAGAKDTKSFTDALDQDTDSLGRNTDAIGTNTEALIRKQLADKNQIDDIARIGAGLHNGKSAWDTWTEAVNGSGTAAMQLRQAMLDTNEVTLESIPGHRASAEQIDKLTQSWLLNGGTIEENEKHLGIWNGTADMTLRGNVALSNSLYNQTQARKGSKQAIDDEIASGIRNTDGTLKEAGAKGKDAAATDKSTSAKKANTVATADEIAANKAAAKAADDHRKAFADLAKIYGVDAATIINRLHASTAAEEAFAKSGDELRTGIASSFGSATDIVAQFGNQAQVSSQQVMDWLTNQVTAAASWSSNMAKLAQSGIDEGLLETLAKAGPKAAPLVQAILDKVQAGGVGAINNLETMANTILTNTQNDILNHRAQVYANSLLLGQSASDGFVAGAGTITFHAIPGTNGVWGSGVWRRSAIGGLLKPGESSLVGDAGVEVVDVLPGGGAYVHTNSETRKMMAKPSHSTTAGAPVVLHLNMPVHVEVAGTSSTADEISAAIEHGIKRGGDHILDGLLDLQRRGGGSVVALLERG